MAPRNPNWARDELIIALDLYLTRGQLDEKHPEVLKVSGILNALPIHTMRPDVDKFRNPAGVALKLANFAALDPEYGGTGMTRGGKGDVAVWEEFSDMHAVVHELALVIESSARAAPVQAAIPEEGEDEVAEGKVLYRLHRARERNRSIVKKKKAAVLAAGGALACEPCGLVFSQMYGPAGADYIEVHHRVPLHVSGPTTTKLGDLALICANCHRIIHQSKPWLTVKQLAAIVAANRAPTT
jgi:5-methylcytosine-specific restriction protein A